ncbi:hypothetical protein F4677DRAFT_440621 [Hypoxylon crocopeplum]|nr:hypothetical protein F4677DRAFT_440621 [Hypoxylon crocopeplum]
MCVEVWNSYQGCGHKTYQNTAPCQVARRGEPDSDYVLKRTKFLPDKPPKIPPGLLNCKLRIATRPKNSGCPVCARKARQGKEASGSNTADSSTMSDQSKTPGNNSRPKPKPRTHQPIARFRSGEETPRLAALPRTTANKGLGSLPSWVIEDGCRKLWIVLTLDVWNRGRQRENLQTMSLRH